MKHSKKKLFILFAIFALPAIASEQIAVKAKIIESPDAIDEDLSKLAKTKGVEILATPKVITPSGEEAQIEIIREFIPGSGATTGKFETVNTGTIIRVTPMIKEGQLVFSAQVTLCELVGVKGDEKQSQSELLTRDFYISGTPKDGEAVWFHFEKPHKGKQLAIWLQLERQREE